jgi:hypothetical protein
MNNLSIVNKSQTISNMVTKPNSGQISRGTGFSYVPNRQPQMTYLKQWVFYSKKQIFCAYTP